MTLRMLISGVALILAAAGGNALQDDSETELEALRGRMEELRRSLEADEQKRNSVQSELRQAESEIGTRMEELRRLRGKQQQADRRLLALAGERDALDGRIRAERRSLAAQVRAAYVAGRHERLKLLLNQQDPASLGRMIVYYDYFNRMRRRTIEGVSADLARLTAIAAEQEAAAAELRVLEQRKTEEIERLDNARARRAEVLASLDDGIRGKGAEIARMEAQADALEKLVEELREALRNFPVESDRPFDEVKGQLSWPLNGRLLKDFGQPRAHGRLKWDGVLVGAEQGTQVHAVYHGRVAYADWLTGLGLLVIIEHGDGYMTLYGHNESVFRSVGEWVGPGDAIATVGNSGGQTQSALYFEIRKGKDPQNPHRWFAGELKTP